MVIESKFNIGDTVYYWSIEKVKIMRGKITSISTYTSEVKGEGIKSNFKYYITPNSSAFIISECIPEHLVFLNRDDVFEFCMALTKDI